MSNSGTEQSIPQSIRQFPSFCHLLASTCIRFPCCHASFRHIVDACFPIFQDIHWWNGVVGVEYNDNEHHWRLSLFIDAKIITTSCVVVCCWRQSGGAGMSSKTFSPYLMNEHQRRDRLLKCVCMGLASYPSYPVNIIDPCIKYSIANKGGSRQSNQLPAGRPMPFLVKCACSWASLHTTTAAHKAGTRQCNKYQAPRSVSRPYIPGKYSTVSVTGRPALQNEQRRTNSETHNEMRSYT